MKTMLDARIVAASTHRAAEAAHGAVQGAARIDAASDGDDESGVIGCQTRQLASA